MGLLLCEKLGRKMSNHEVTRDSVKFPQTDSIFPLLPKPFLTRLRNVSLAVTVMLGAILLSQLVRSSVDVWSSGIWRIELPLALVESGRWFVICWMVVLP
jgi:hypothetical protein